MYSYKEGTPVNFIVTQYTYAGEVKPVLSFTHDGPVDFKYMLATEYSVVMAGNLKKGDQAGVSVVVTIPSENGDIFKNMNTYDYKEYAKAVGNNDINRVRTLAAFGVSPVFNPGTSGDVENEIDNPLLLAFKLGYYDIAEELLAGGADPDRVDKMPIRYFIYELPEIYNLPLTPLMYIALTPGFYDAQKYMDLLKKYNADFTKITRDGNAFDQAVKMQYTSFMDLYVNYVTLSASDLERKMESAIENDLPVSLKWLLDHGANPSVRNYLGDVIIEKGLETGSKEVKAVLKEWQKAHKK
jgi:ankyrin repeat protein